MYPIPRGTKWEYIYNVEEDVDALKYAFFIAKGKLEFVIDSITLKTEDKILAHLFVALQYIW
jgi:hypothetical protein